MKKTTIGLGVIFLGIALIILMGGPGHDITNPNVTGDTIVCFGDSLTFGTGAENGMSYPDQLSRMIGRPVINAGVPGDTTRTALDRLSEDVLSKNPDIVLITLGGNDLKNGISKEEAFANLETIVRTIQGQGALVILAGIDIPFFGKGFGDAYKQLAKDTGSLLIPDIFKGIMGKTGLMSDRIHPNAKGYTIMAEHFHKKIGPYIR
ncbi:arylesterase [Desulfatiferula olefinivorans]